MRRKSTLAITLSFILIFSFNSAISADDYADATSITWEKVQEPFFNKYNPFGVGARAIGMGEAFTAIADDAAAVYYNPAGLAQMNHNEIHWTGGSYYGEAPYTNFASFVMSLGGQYFGLSYMKLYHPIGRYPDKIVIPAGVPDASGTGINSPTGAGLFPGDSGDIFIPAGTYEEWYGDLQPSQQEFLAEKYREFINRPFQENQILLTYATPLTADRSFMFGLNVKYQFTDADMKNYLNDFTGRTGMKGGDEVDAWAWALDVGFLYKLRIIDFLKDFNIGIMLRDVSGRRKYFNTGIEGPLYFTSTLAMSMRTTELIEKEITSFSIDWDAVNDPGVLENEKNRLKFGVEQWLLDNHFAVRGGLVYFMYPGPWRFSVGLSARYWLGLDYAYVRGIPFDQKSENEEESHWVTVYWQWGEVKRKLPSPDVFAAVEPISFAPRNGEVVLFKLNASSKAGIDRWALNILDKKNNLVKSYIDIGMPPSQIVWNGTDNKYQLLPDGEYSFIFEATDKLGSTASTPVQTVKIYTPVIHGVNPEALDQLKALLNRIKDRDVAEDAAVKQQAERDLQALKEKKEKPTPVPPPGPAPTPSYESPFFGIDGAGLTTNAGFDMASGPINVLGFPNIDSGMIRSAFIETTPEGLRQFNMDYVTANTLPKYVLQEMTLMVRSVAESLGVNQVQINALYGGTNNMTLTVPEAQARNYSNGLITAEQMLRGSSILLNGEAIHPNF